MHRELARDRGIRWTEYWSFLNCYTDLATPEGLGKLEQYFVNKRRSFSSSHASYEAADGGTVKTHELPRTPESRRSDVIVSGEVSYLSCDQGVVVSNERENRIAGSPTWQHSAADSLPSYMHETIPVPPMESLDSVDAVDKMDQESYSESVTEEVVSKQRGEPNPSDVPHTSQRVLSPSEEDLVAETERLSLKSQKDLAGNTEKATDKDISSGQTLTQGASSHWSPDVSPTQSFPDESFCKKNLLKDFYSDEQLQQRESERKGSVSGNETVCQSESVDIGTSEAQCELLHQTQEESKRGVSNDETTCRSKGVLTEGSPAQLVLSQQGTDATERRATSLATESIRPTRVLHKNSQEVVNSEDFGDQNLTDFSDSVADAKKCTGVLFPNGKTSNSSVDLMTEGLTDLTTTNNPRILSKIFIQG